MYSQAIKINPFLGFISRVGCSKAYMDLKNSSASEQKWCVLQSDSYIGKKGNTQHPPFFYDFRLEPKIKTQGRWKS